MHLRSPHRAFIAALGATVALTACGGGGANRASSSSSISSKSTSSSSSTRSSTSSSSDRSSSFDFGTASSGAATDSRFHGDDFSVALPDGWAEDAAALGESSSAAEAFLFHNEDKSQVLTVQGIDGVESVDLAEFSKQVLRNFSGLTSSEEPQSSSLADAQGVQQLAEATNSKGIQLTVRQIVVKHGRRIFVLDFDINKKSTNTTDASDIIDSFEFA